MASPVPLSAPAREAAERLWRAEQEGVAVEPVRDLIAPGDVETAYAVQLDIRRRHEADGRRLVGRKIGLTSIAVQQQLGVDRPDFGAVFADRVFSGDELVPFSGLIQPRVEAEVAVVLGRELPDPDATILEVQRAIEAVVPAIEIVDSRVRDWDITLVDTVADNASSGAVVLGAARPFAGDLHDLDMTMWSGEEVVSTGNTVACLGDPLIAVRWLARELARLGDPLQPGDLVMSGALGPMVPARAGQSFRAVIETLGEVRLQFEGESA